MKRRGRKEHSKQGDEQNTFIFITKHVMIYLKHYYGSIIVRKIVLCVCVCVCVCVCAWLTQLKLQKGLNNKSIMFMLTMYSFLSVVRFNCCFRGWKKSHRRGILRKRMFAWPIHFVAFGVCWWIRESDSIPSGSHTGESVLALQVKLWKRGRVFEDEVYIENTCLGVNREDSSASCNDYWDRDWVSPYARHTFTAMGIVRHKEKVRGRSCLKLSLSWISKYCLKSFQGLSKQFLKIRL